MDDSIPEIDVKEARRRLDAGEALIDVREPDEHQDSRIPGAKLLPMSEFAGRFRDELPTDSEVMVQCRSGARSGRITQLLLDEGYRAVNVAGGILAWEEEGLPIERG